MCHQLVFLYQFDHLQWQCERIYLLPMLIQNPKGVSEPDALLHIYMIYPWWFGYGFGACSAMVIMSQWKKNECYTYGTCSWTLNLPWIVPVSCHSDFYLWYQYPLTHYPVSHLPQPCTSSGIDVQILLCHCISRHIYYFAQKCNQKRECKHIT